VDRTVVEAVPQLVVRENRAAQVWNSTKIIIKKGRKGREEERKGEKGLRGERREILK
jgi:hypothetical protein